MSLLLPSIDIPARGSARTDENVENHEPDELNRQARAATGPGPQAIATAVWHSLLWLVIANAVGVLLAALLVFPGINHWFAEWTYGTWMPVHLNLQLYGWCSLPLVAYLIKLYGADRQPAAGWTRPVLWLWSVTLAIGSASWLNGQSSGKLFLDWTGFTRVLFPLALLSLWALLAYALLTSRHSLPKPGFGVRVAKMAGLLLLLMIPFILYVASSPALYPPINPDSGGPTGASQLESTLVIIAILLLLPLGLVDRHAVSRRPWQITTAVLVFLAESLLCLFLGRADVSHHRPIQWISLASLLVWVPLIPAYYSVFPWHRNTQKWRIAFLAWWAILIPTGWTLFLPGVLDHFKFTDGLVGHSLLAMAGFVSSLLVFVLVQLLGDDGWIFNMRWSFTLWHACVACYVGLMFYAGWLEGSDPGFSILPGMVRNLIYTARLLLGVGIFIASVDWFFWSFDLFRKPVEDALEAR